MKKDPNHIRIAIFDDNDDRRRSLNYLLGMYPEMEVVGSFNHANNAKAEVQSLHPDVILMDIEMPGTNGIEAVRQIKNAVPDAVILMQTVFDQESIIFEAISAGASGYIIKKSPPEKIIEGIRDAYAGGAPVSPAIALKILQHFQNPNKIVAPSVDMVRKESLSAAIDLYALTPREVEILAQLVEGKSYKMVGAALHISYNTVNSHVRHIYDKLHVHSLGEVVAKALKERLV